jgi:hypothetical protein
MALVMGPIGPIRSLPATAAYILPEFIIELPEGPDSVHDEDLGPRERAFSSIPTSVPRIAI